MVLSFEFFKISLELTISKPAIGHMLYEVLLRSPRMQVSSNKQHN